MEIVVSEGKVDYIDVFEGDNIENLVKIFGEKYKLSDQKLKTLAKVV